MEACTFFELRVAPAMPNAGREKPDRGLVLKRQLAACTAFLVLLAIVVGTLYWQDRRREWTLRSEQAKHRLDTAFTLVTRELERVRADILFLADQQAVRHFAAGQVKEKAAIEAEYVDFLRRKTTYDQIRLLDLQGREAIRVNFDDLHPVAVPASELQDKSDRYYFRDALSLAAGEVAVSDFDLNLEHGQVEQPLKPVIRFTTPIVDDQSHTRAILVLNYLGSQLLSELVNPSLPGATILLRHDGHYLRGLHQEDAWGWLLGHDRTFARQFPAEWARIDDLTDCALTSNGAFAARRIWLAQPTAADGDHHESTTNRESIVLVSYVPRSQVFVASGELLQRLLLVAGCIFVPLVVFTRFWATAVASREIQGRRIAQSEERLRELSARLLRIQEDERRAISREIHDELGQQVTAINLDLKLADRNLETGKARPHLERAIGENAELLKSLHAFATRVRPAVLDDLGLFDAIESHMWEFQERTRIDVDVDLSARLGELPDDVADHVYRLLQESLNNVAKHADARRVSVRLAFDETAAGNLRLVVSDDGRGYDNGEAKKDRLGLVGMQERVDLLGGTLQLDSSIDVGTRVEIVLPLEHRVSQMREIAE